MFSHHVKKIDKLTYRALLGVAAGLVILCQLIAMALVVDGQVQRAQVREARYSSEQIAVADCIESKLGAALVSCIRQLRSEGKVLAEADSNSGIRRPVATAYAPDLENPALPSHPVQGLMPASFSIR